MNATPLLIVGGLAGLWLLVESRQKQMSGVIVGGGVAPLSTSNTDAQVTAGIGTALRHDPDPTGISQAVLGVADQISGMFTQAHDAALRKEANTLNNATPTFISQVEQVVTALNQGQISESQAIAYLGQARDIYYETVGGIIRGRWPYIGSQFPEPTYTDSYRIRTGPYGSSSSNPDSHAPSTCNAACVVGHYFIERTVVGLTKIINRGGGTIIIDASPQNGQIRGTPAIQLTYTRPSAAGFVRNELTAIGNLF